MISLLIVTLTLTTSYEVILDFDHYSPIKDLYSSLPPDIKPFLKLENKDTSSISNFLLVSSDFPLSFSTIPHLQGVFAQKQIFHKSLSLLSESNGNKVTDLIESEKLWAEGQTGQGVKIGILDSGMRSGDLKQIKVFECKNFSDDLNCEDTSGHGTFMASIITGLNPDCPGIAPNAEVYSLKVFNSKGKSLTSWFLDAFNYAIQQNITILSLSTGGIDFLDEPFVRKITELVSLGIVIVSAAGNDGPGFGTLSNPGDQPEVIGVGGLDETGMHVSDFSSRGPTL